LATNLMRNPERVPHLRRSLREAKPLFVRAGGTRPSVGLHIFDAFLMGEPTISTWQCELLIGAPPVQTDAEVPLGPRSGRLKNGCASLLSNTIRRLLG